jgi:hypothetical protein
MSESKLIVPAQVKHWVDNLSDKKNNEFQKDLYRQRIEGLITYLSEAVAKSRPKPTKDQMHAAAADRAFKTTKEYADFAYKSGRSK